MELNRLGGGGGGGSAITITEQDGTPSGTLSILKVTNGTLTDDGGGTFSLITGGGGGTGIVSINSDTTTSQVLAVASSGTDFAIVDNGTGTHTFNLPSASATNRGALTSTDWSTFNSKLSTITIGSTTITSGTTGRVLYDNAGKVGELTTTGTGTTIVLQTSPTIVTPTIAKLANLTSNGIVATSSGDGTLNVYATTGTGSTVVLQTSPTLVTPNLGTPTTITLTNGTGLPISTGVSGFITTTDIWVDGNRVDSYTPTGTIALPYKTIGAAMTAITSAGLAAVMLHIAAGTYVENVTGSNIPFVIYGNGATIIGNLTLSKAFDIYDLTVIGNVTQSDTSLTAAHQFESGFVSGDITTSGLAIFNGMATGGGTITVNAGSLGAFNGNVLSSRVVNKGTMYLNNTSVTLSSTTSYAVDSSTAGSLFYGLGIKITNNGTGGGVNLSNTTTATLPNEIDNVDIIVGGTTNGLTCGTANTVAYDYNIFGSTGPLAATGSNFIPTYRSGGMVLAGSTSGTTTLQSSAVSSGTLTLPAATDTLVGKATVDTLTNKTITSPVITNSVTSMTASLASDDTFTGVGIYGLNASTTIAQWDLVTLNASSQWIKANASTTSTSFGMLAMAATAGTINNPLNTVVGRSLIRNDSWAWTTSVPLYVSTTAGTITATAPSGTGQVIRVVGFSVNTTTIFFDPSQDYITHT